MFPISRCVGRHTDEKRLLNQTVKPEGSINAILTSPRSQIQQIVEISRTICYFVNIPRPI